MKRSELIFNIVSIPMDIISLTLAGVVSFYVRLHYVRIPIVFLPDISSFTNVLKVAILVLLIIFTMAGMYNLRATRKFSQEFSKIVGSISIALLIVIVTFFFNQRIFPSRFIILTSWGLAILFVVIGRYILKKIQGVFLARGYGLHKLAIINGPEADLSLISQLKNNKQLGYNVVAVLNPAQDMVAELNNFYEKGNLEEIMQANPKLSEQDNLDLVSFARQRGLIFSFVPNLFNVQRSIIETENIEGLPVIILKNTPLEGWGRVVKRIFDVVCSCICLLITSPLFLAISILIKLDTSGKVLYSAPRGGQNKDFIFYKFRTMHTHMSVGDGYGGEEAEKVRNELWKVNARGGESGPFLKIKDDPRVTKIGKFLRKTKLDEIPQFLNVLRGEMSMVGPRAHVIDEVNKYRDEHRRLFTIKPGIFGLSQIAQLSWPDLPFEEEVRLNTYYIENWSVWLDIKILAQSFVYLFISKKEDY